MSARILTTPRLFLTMLATLAALVAGLAVSTSPAKAHSDVSSKIDKRNTSNCPCHLNDEYDGTHFYRDAGGVAAKVRVYAGGRLAGKAEFHPYDEKLWIYDTLSNNDAIYYRVYVNGRWKRDARVPNGRRHATINMSIAEGARVTVYAWDNFHYQSGHSKFIGSVEGRA